MDTSFIKKALGVVASAALAVGMIAGSTVAANADEGDAATTTGTSITINSTDQDLTNRTFVAHKVLDITGVSGDNYTTAVNDTYRVVLQSTAQTVLETEANASDADLIAAISAMTDASKIRAFADTLSQNIAEATPEITPTVTSDQFTLSENKFSVTASNVANGWYLVEETTTADANSGKPNHSPLSLVMLKPASGAVTIDIKDKVPTSDKKIVDNYQGTNPRDVDDYAENADIVYQLTFTIPSEWATQYEDGFWFTMKDTLSKGLTFDSTPAPEIYVRDNNTETKWDETTYGYAPEVQPTAGTADEYGNIAYSWAFGTNAETEDAQTIREANLKLAGKTVVLYYHAHLNENAIVAGTGNPNTYHVTYQHNPYNAADGTDTPESTPRVYTFDFDVIKVDGNKTETKLAGATFKLTTDAEGKNSVYFLQNSEGVYQVVKAGTQNAVDEYTTTDTGTIQLSGLDSGTYYLWETKAPDGYQKLDGSTTVTIAHGTLPTDGVTSVTFTLNGADTDDVTIKNFKGNLPQTGGAGIALMVVVGALLIGGGAFMLTSKSRQQAA